MAGHSKWSNIKHKKEKTDAQRAKIFTKVGREIAMAIREGGSADPNNNSRLRDAIAKAKANNVPNDNIDRIIRRASGEDSDVKYESITYEGYGPAGIAVLVETLTDNRNRTAADVRHYFDKYGGNLGQSGCVSFLFNRKGIIVIERGDKDEDKVMEDALESGADDFYSDEEIFEVYTDPADFGEVCSQLEERGYSFLSAQIEFVPDTYVTLTDEEDKAKMEKLLSMLEDNDDVQNVWHNMKENEDN